MTKDLADVWNESYRRKENYVFYPQEEMVRFMSRHVRKRVGLDEFADQRKLSQPPRGLDLGCGIGRHMVFMWDLGIEPYGIDLSAAALEVARNWAARAGIPPREDQFHLGTVTELPWPDGFFDVALSHGVLDSMPFATAQQAIPELHRVLRDGGVFCCDLVSSDDSRHAPDFDGQEIVETPHERGTVQSYFTVPKIQRLLGDYFKILQIIHIRSQDLRSQASTARFHLALEKC